MLGSIGFGELLFIGVVVLIIFGPHRLPEIARRAGDLLSRARAATKEFTDSLDAEYEGATAPLRDLKQEYDATKGQLSDTASKLTDLTSIDPMPSGEKDSGSTDRRDRPDADDSAIAEPSDEPDSP